jgi:hypothetical protein
MFFSTGVSQLWETIDWQMHSEDHPRPSADELLAQLPDFPFAEKTFVSRSFDKMTSVGVFASLKTDFSPLEVVAAFKSSLLDQGWVITKEKVDPYVSLKLCRRGIAATIEPSTTPSGTKAAVILGWSYSKGSSSYCPT